MSVQSSSGCKFYIGPSNDSATTEAAYDALSYTEVAEIADLGEFGDKINEVNFIALADARNRKFKGSKDAGTMVLDLGYDTSDAGQAALESARDDTSAATEEYAFKVELNDSAGTNPTTFYFRGLVLEAGRIKIGNADSIIMNGVSVAINSAIVKKAAA